jgi:hypothetical protein
VSRPALGLTQPPVQWVPGIISPGQKRGRGVTLTTHPHLVPRSELRTIIGWPVSGLKDNIKMNLRDIKTEAVD